MSDILSMMGMAGNYDERKVARFDDGGLHVSTAAVTDSDEPYETAVSHPVYNDGAWVIVQMYGDKAKAASGHEAWVKKMTAKELPKQLEDVSTAVVAEFCDTFGGKDWRTQEAKDE